MIPWFAPAEPPREASCEERTAIESHGLPVRASAQLGAAKLEDRALRFAANVGGGFDLVRIERACRPGSGILPDKPHLRTTIGGWFDATWPVHATTSLRPAMHVTFGRHDVGFIALPEWEVFAIVGAARAQSWRPSMSVGVRLVMLQAELRADLSRPGGAYMAFVGVHFDPAAW